MVLCSSVAGLGSSSCLSHEALLDFLLVLQISVGLPDLQDSISRPPCSEHVPETPVDVVLRVRSSALTGGLQGCSQEEGLLSSEQTHGCWLGSSLDPRRT